MKTLRVFSSEEMRMFDAWVGSKFNIPETTLVEHAGRECFRSLERSYDLESLRSALFLVGSGGNGADGLVMARLFASFGSYQSDPISIHVLITKPLEQQRELNHTLLNQLLSLGVKVDVIENLEPEQIRNIIGESDLIVDAILGTGISGDVSSNIQFLLRELRGFRSQTSKLIALDIPSGVSSDIDVMQVEPYLGGHADKTFVIQGYKMAHMAPGAERYCGQLELLDIGMPQYGEGRDLKSYVDRAQVVSYLSHHTNSNLGHKGKKGHLFVIAGSESMSGAGVLSSVGAFKAGVGKVTTTFPKNTPCSNPTIMSLPMDTEGGAYSNVSFDAVSGALKGKQAIVIGPGLGLSDSIYDLFVPLLEEIKKSGLPCVLDADAITLVSRMKGERDLALTDHFVLSPHEGEFLRLEKAYFEDSLLAISRYEAVKRLALQIQANILLKGPKSLFFDLKSGAFYNPHQSASLAVGGSGDVLSGLMGGFFARGYSVKEGVVLATFLHGLAGRMLDDKYINGVGVDAKIILDEIPKAYRDLLLN